MQYDKNSLSILSSPAFLVGLGLLLLNDFFLKSTFHNWFTGKLSDFAGLFIFPLFFTAFFPQRKRLIYAVTAIGFVFWKSEFSQPLITFWNTQPYYQIDRIVDYSDLIALLILPLSFLYLRQLRSREVKPLLVCTASIFAVFAFAATQAASYKATFTQEYYFAVSQAELLKQITIISEDDLYDPKSDKSKAELAFRKRQKLPVELEIHFKDYAFREVKVIVTAEGESSKVSLLSAEIKSFSKTGKEEFIHYFEREFIEEVKKNPAKKSPEITSIWFTYESLIQSR
jgi:hypothetical protein